jgi:hypothetical protein
MLTTDRFGYGNSAYYLDGNDNIVMPNYAAMINTVGTLSCWFKIGLVGKVYIVGVVNQNDMYNEHFALAWYKYADRLEGDVKFNSQCNPGQGWIKAFTTLSYQDEKWHHAILTWGDGNVNVYVDAALVATAATPKNLADACAGGILCMPTLGKIDDIAIYNRILTESERNQLFGAESSRIVPVIKH